MEWGWVGGRVLFLLLFSVVLPVRAQAKPVPTTRIETILIVDPVEIGAKERVNLFRALSTRTSTARWPTVKAMGGDTLYGLIEKHYGFAIRRDRLEATSIGRQVIEANKLKPDGSVSFGQELSFPVLPVKPAPKKNDRNGVAQIFDLYTRTLVGANLAQCAVSNARTCGDEAVEDGATWVFSGPHEQLRAIADVIEPAKRRPIYEGPSTETIRVEQPPATAFEMPGAALPEPMDVSAELRHLTSSLSATNAPTLFLLDFYEANNACGHGRKVRDVSDLVLRELAAQHLLGKIQPIELSFYPHNPQALKVLDRFIDKYRPEVRDQLRRFRESLVALYRDNDDRQLVPILYLMALYDELLDESDDSVISSSFFTTADIFKVLPKSYLPSSNSVLLSAALNLPSSVEDTQYEPQKTFYDLRHDYGLILVGSWNRLGDPFGMSSRAGDGVTCIGYGFGWKGECIGPSDGGNSFATPAIATMMLLAKAYWKSHGESLDGVAAKRRLLLSSRPTSKFEHYASMGPPSMSRLLLRRGAYAITDAASPVPFPGLKGNVFFVMAGADGESMLPFGAGGVAGVQFGGATSASDFLFVDGQEHARWAPAKVKRLELTYKVGPTTVPFDTSSFSNLKGLIAP